jgi:hypothetical protein
VTRKYIEMVIGVLVALLVLISVMFSISRLNTLTSRNVPACDAEPLAHVPQCFQP